jgi:hypothetical protein
MPHPHRRLVHLVLALGLAAALAPWSGCSSVRALHSAAKPTPAWVPTNFSGVPHLPSTLRRVVILPVAPAAGIPAHATDAFDVIVVSELQRTARFEVVVADPAAMVRLCDRRSVLSVDALPPGFLSLVAREYDAEAVMFIDISALSPYEPIALGFRAKLVGVDGSMLWAFDTLFSTGDPAIAEAARRHDRKQHPAMGPGDLSLTVLQSPARLADFAAATAFSTLPPR